MSKEINQTILLAIIALLVIWLIYRIRNSVRQMIKDEIYKNFPTIKGAIDNFERRIEYLKTKIEQYESKLK